ncbi:L,D-transpeptidase [Candidatus Dojkabacteria bacterium]|nr:L,D-transpeptidase [Candidatus Dojkabacteria bacterium]
MKQPDNNATFSSDTKMENIKEEKELKHDKPKESEKSGRNSKVESKIEPKTSITTENTQKLKSEAPTPKKKKKNHVFRTILLVLIPGVLVLALKVQADTRLHLDNIERTREGIEYYYFNGWPIDDIYSDFEETYPEDNTFALLLSTYSNQRPETFTNKLDNSINFELTTIETSLHDLDQRTTQFYVDEIAQDTSEIEKTRAEISEGLELNNYYQITSSLGEYGIEISELDKKQRTELDARITDKLNTIEDIAFMAGFYDLNLGHYVDESQQINLNEQDELQKYYQLEDLKNKAAAEFDNAILARGGQISEGQRIFIVIRSQHMYMVEDYEIIYDMPMSSGKYGHATALGEFQVYEKVPMAWGIWEIWMPYWLTIYYSGGSENGIHGIPISPINGRWSNWDNVVGVQPITYGCIMPHDWDAKYIYDWAEVGTPVSIVW